MRAVLYQCKTCGNIVGARERRGHVADVHHENASAFTAIQMAARFTRFDKYDPSRAEKWGYSDDEIRRVIPGLQPTPGEESTGGDDEAMEPRHSRA